MRIVTWNINSVRLRLENLSKLSSEISPDIICLQETKVRDSEFPFEYISNLGYPYIAICGEKSYNGVAILSRIKFENIQFLKLVHQDACRHISVDLPDNTTLHNFYVPAGGDIPDSNLNPQFAYKLSFLDHMTELFSHPIQAQKKLILVGDLNVAPLEHDVWSHKQLLKVVSHTPIEVTKLSNLQKTLNWYDANRFFIPKDQKLYSWWSYRNRDWRKSDRGRRLDHIWFTPQLFDNLKNAYILKNARDWILPSDHVPVIAEFKI
ncbi:Exodeoxyribonuclease III [Rickettsiales bacterium Ac37b]|nr:Exodeoxyribonuclease III [Rickettsiales bacterium Ac37b]